jgi:hypothetical protein
MTLSSGYIKELTLSLLNQETERDKQRKVGASNLSDPCTRHLAHAMIGAPEAPVKYWLGGKIGTAIHSFIESAIGDSSNPVFSGSLVEHKILLGQIAGYGDVHSKPDLVLPAISSLIDWKTTSRKKIKKIQDLVDGVKHDLDAEYTMQKYLGQTQLYAWGLNKSGIKVDDIAIVFINRDGTYENDIWAYTVPYQEEVAVALWDRATALWTELENGAHPDSYAPHPQCFKCSVGI